jgi:hypothetical protein
MGLVLTQEPGTIDRTVNEGFASIRLVALIARDAAIALSPLRLPYQEAVRFSESAVTAYEHFMANAPLEGMYAFRAALVDARGFWGHIPSTIQTDYLMHGVKHKTAGGFLFMHFDRYLDATDLDKLHTLHVKAIDVDSVSAIDLLSEELRLSPSVQNYEALLAFPPEPNAPRAMIH